MSPSLFHVPLSPRLLFFIALQTAPTRERKIQRFFCFGLLAGFVLRDFSFKGFESGFGNGFCLVITKGSAEILSFVI